jgi:membrane protein YqaA with SNARE-associated domain
MPAFFSSLFSAFLSPAGLFALAALDSSMIFFLPLAVDVAVVILVARYSEFFWAFPLLATAGSMIGAFVTFKVGEKIGENSLDVWIPEGRLKSIRTKVKNKGAIALAVPAVMPPPFPLTPFVLACGAFKVKASTYFGALAIARLVRYTITALLALIYGRQIIGVLDSTAFKVVIGVLAVIAVAGTVFTLYRVIRRTKAVRSRPRERAA